MSAARRAAAGVVPAALSAAQRRTAGTHLPGKADGGQVIP
mgnify:CR=1 FL=1